MYKASVIVPTYNRLEALKLVLEGFKRQSEKDFEIIVADDGSTDETANYLNKNEASFPFSLKHVWQEDRGFRKSRIVNMAIAKSESDYLIFCDGDCIPHKEFVKAQLASGESCSYLVGRSVILSKKISNSLSLSKIENGWLDGINLKVFFDYVFGNTKYWEYSIYIKSHLILNFIYQFRKSRSLFGGNFSAYKSDMIKINGYNEDLVGWGGEDGEIGQRLFNLGLKPKLVICKAINYHYHHDGKHKRTVETIINVKKSTFAKESGLIYCENGLDKHLNKK